MRARANADFKFAIAIEFKFHWIANLISWSNVLRDRDREIERIRIRARDHANIDWLKLVDAW